MLAVAADTQQLGTGGLFRADCLEPGSALSGYLRGSHEGFDIVHNRRSSHMAVSHRKRRSDSRYTTLAFEGFKQCRFFAADIGPGAHVNFDIKVETGLAEDIAPEQSIPTPCCKGFFERLPHIKVFAAKIQVTMTGANDARTECHACEHIICMTVEQDTVLEGSRFTFIGIADHYTVICMIAVVGLAAELPLHRRVEAGTTTAAQT